MIRFTVHFSTTLLSFPKITNEEKKKSDEAVLMEIMMVKGIKKAFIVFHYKGF